MDITVHSAYTAFAAMCQTLRMAFFLHSQTVNVVPVCSCVYLLQLEEPVAHFILKICVASIGRTG